MSDKGGAALADGFAHGSPTTDNHPKVESAWVRKFAWSALIYSGVMSAVAWLTPLWQSSKSVQAVFGGDILAPVVLFLSLMVVGVVLDVISIGLTVALVAKPKRKANLIVCAIALLLLVAPVVADSVYSAAIASGASS